MSIRSAVAIALLLLLVGTTAVVYWSADSLFSLARRAAPLGVPGFADGVYQPSFSTEVDEYSFETVNLEVPRNYVWHVFKHDHFVTDLQLHVALPSFQPLNLNNKEYFLRSGSSDVKMNIGIRDTPINIDERIDYNVVMLGQLTKEFVVDKDQSSSQFILYRSPPEHVTPKRVYVLRNLSHTKSPVFATCRLSGLTGIKFCEGLTYTFPGIYVKFTFLESQIGRLAVLHSNTEKLVASFISTNQ